MATNVINPSVPVAVLPYTDTELTNAINALPTPFGQMTGEGFFPGEGLPTQYVEVDIVNGVLSALPVTGDGPGTLAKHETVGTKIFKIPTVSHFDSLKASDIRSMLTTTQRAGARAAETLANLTNRRLGNFKKKFNLTWELMRMSALKGIVIDGAGVEVYNYYTAFSITPKVVYFDLSNANADIKGACDQVFQLITQDISDEVMTTVECRVSRDFFNKLTQHPKVEKFWLQTQDAQALASGLRGEDGGYRPRRFTFGDITFIEYSAVVPMWGGTNMPIIANGTGHAYPAGTMDSHVTYVAPPDDISVLDGSDASVDDAIHLTSKVLDHGKGVEWLGRMNVLPMWRRPNLLVTLYAGAGVSTVAKDGL